MLAAKDEDRIGAAWLIRADQPGDEQLEITLVADVVVPEIFTPDTALNAKIVDAKDQFEVPEVEELPTPTPEQVAKNKEKWGYTG